MTPPGIWIFIAAISSPVVIMLVLSYVSYVDWCIETFSSEDP